MAAALHFEEVKKSVIEQVIGWCKKTNRPKKGGGLFCVPKAWLRIAEEQSRLTLHAHFLIWIYGHENLEEQLQEADNQDRLNEKRLLPTSPSQTAASGMKGIKENLLYFYKCFTTLTTTNKIS